MKKTVRTQVLLCAGGSCISSGTPSVREAFETALDKHGLNDEIEVITTGCMGMCEILSLIHISEPTRPY